MDPQLLSVRPDGLALVTLMQDILTHVVTVFGEYNVPTPDRQYYTLGTPAAECNQLVVSFSQMYIGLPGDEGATPQRCDVPLSAVFTVSVFRCVPVEGARGQAPSTDQLMTAADWQLVDAYVLMQASRGCDMWDPSGVGMGVIATVQAG